MWFNSVAQWDSEYFQAYCMEQEYHDTTWYNIYIDIILHDIFKDNCFEPVSCTKCII